MPRPALKQSSGVLIFQRSLKALGNSTKNLKADAVSKDREANKANETKDYSASVTESTSDMSQKRQNSSRRGRGGFRYFSNRRGKSEPGTEKDKHQSKAAEGVKKDGQGQPKGFSSSDGEKTVARDITKKVLPSNASLEEDWTKDLMETDKSMETKSPSPDEEDKNKDKELPGNSKGRMVAEQVDKDKEVEKVNDVIKDFCEPGNLCKSDVGGPLQSTPKKNLNGEPFENCAFELSDPEGFDIKQDENANMCVVQSKGGSMKIVMPEKINQKGETVVKNIPVVEKAVSHVSKNNNLNAIKVVSENQKDKVDRNLPKEGEESEAKSNIKNNGASSGIVNSRTSSAVDYRTAGCGFRRGHHRRHCRGPEPLRKFEPVRADTPPRLRVQARGRYRCFVSPENRQRFGPKVTPKKNPVLKSEYYHVSKPKGQLESVEKKRDEVVVSDVKKSSENASQGWELPTSEDWTSEIDGNEEYLRIVSEGLVEQTAAAVENECKDDDSQVWCENQMEPANVEMNIDSVQEKMKEVYKDKPYLPPPPPMEECGNSTLESLYNTAKDSLHNTATAECKAESQMETSFQSQDDYNTCQKDDVDKWGKKDFFCKDETHSSPLFGIKSEENVITRGNEVDECGNIDLDRYRTIISPSVVESDKIHSESQSETLDKARKLFHDNGELTPLDEVDAYVADLSDVEFYENGTVSQENTYIDFPNVHQCDSSIERIGSSDFSEEYIKKENQRKLMVQEGKDGIHESMKPPFENFMYKENKYREWYQRNYFEWYNYYYGNCGRYSHWDWPAPDCCLGIGMNGWESPDLYHQPCAPVGLEMQQPWLSKGRMSDFWQDRMPHWVDSQKEIAKTQQASRTVEDCKLQLKEKVNSNQRMPKNDSNAREERKSHACHRKDGINNESQAVGDVDAEARKEKAEMTKNQSRASGEDRHVRQDMPRERVGDRDQCVCKEENVQYLLWRMCKCSEGNPPRLQKIYHGGQEEWSVDLGYQSYDSIDDMGLSSHSAAGKFFPCHPTAASTPGFVMDNHKPWQTDGVCPKAPYKPSLTQKLIHGGPRPPPGFQPLVYMMTSDNRPTGSGAVPSCQQSGGASGVQDVDYAQRGSVRESMDVNNRQGMTAGSCDVEENNNVASERVVHTVSDCVDVGSDVNNNKLPRKSVGCDVEAANATESGDFLPADDATFLKLPASLTSSAAHLAEARASLHKAGLTNANLNSALHTFSEAIMAIGKTLHANQDDCAQQVNQVECSQHANQAGCTQQASLEAAEDRREVGLRSARQVDSCGKCPGTCAFSKTCGADPRTCTAALMDRSVSSPGYFCTRNVSERSSVCDADNESDTSGDDRIMEHPMMAQVSGSAVEAPVQDVFSDSDFDQEQLDVRRKQSDFSSEHSDFRPEQGDNNIRKVQFTQDRKDKQEFDQRRVKCPFPSNPPSARRSFIPSDFRPRSHFLNNPPLPRFDQRYTRHFYGGETLPGHRWDPPPYPWEMPFASTQYERRPQSGSFKCSTPPGWKINPPSGGLVRKPGPDNTSYCSQQTVGKNMALNKTASSEMEDSHNADYRIDRCKDTKSCKLVNYASSEESCDEEDTVFQEPFEHGNVDVSTKNRRTVAQCTSVRKFTPKKFRPDFGNTYDSRSSDEDHAKLQTPNIPEPAVPKWSRPPLKLSQKVLKSFSSDVSPLKPQLPEKRPDYHSGKKRTLAEILAGNRDKTEYSRSNVSSDHCDNHTGQCSAQQRKSQNLSPLHPQSQCQDLPPLPPLPPFPSSPFWGMYMPQSNSALTGTESQDKSYSEAAKVGPSNCWPSPTNRQFNKRFARRSWPISTGMVNYTQSSESDNESRLGTLPDWKRNFKQFHNFGVKYIDTHCHLDFLFSRESFRGNLGDYMAKHPETFPEMFEGCVAVFCNPQSFNPHGGLWLEVAKEDNVWIAMGCHPKMALDFTEVAEQGLRKCLKHSKCIALGEIGLDYSGTFWQHAAEQKQVFRTQLEIALEMQKPLVIHCRAAEDDCLSILKEMVPRDYRIHCHCFTAAYANAMLWLDAFPNLYIGLTPLVTYRTASSSHDTAMKIPLNRLLLETDAPYFIPRCIPKSDLPLSNPGLAITVAKEVAQYQELPVAAVLRQCRLNTKFMYGI